MEHFKRPEKGEYGEFYQGYISMVPEGDLIDILIEQQLVLHNMIIGIPENMAYYAYDEGKWTIAQMLNHINDTERIFCYRALALSRGEKKPIPGYDHNAYVDAVKTDHRTLADLAKEFETIRQATISFYAGMPADSSTKKGIVNGTPMSVRAIAYITIGHLNHHMHILESRYLPQ
jgi:uncharacterized damage-inducible protein DinB